MLKMLRDRILVRPIIRELSAVLIVKNSERTNLGIVVSAGPGKVVNGRLERLDVTVGDTVRYGEFAYPEYREDGVLYQILQEADVAAVVEESPQLCYPEGWALMSATEKGCAMNDYHRQSKLLEVAYADLRVTA